MKSCNLLDSPGSSRSSGTPLQVTLFTLLSLTVRTKQVLVAIDHKRHGFVSSLDMVEALSPVFPKKKDIFAYSKNEWTKSLRLSNSSQN